MKGQLILSFLIFSLLLISCEEEKTYAISFDHVKIAYSDDGSGSTALVFVHGWCIDKEYWSNQVDYFKDDYQVVTLDLVGHGKTGGNRKNWTPENFARDVVAVINELELKEVVLIGHSISEDIIVRAARMEPKKIKALVGVENFKEVGLVHNDSIQKEADRFFALMDKSFGITAQMYANEYLFSPYTKAKTRIRVINDVKKFDPEIGIPILKLLYTDYQEEKRFLKQLITPLHLINSDYWPTDTHALKEVCAHGYTIKYISKVGHYPMIEDPKTFNKLLDETLNEIPTLSVNKKK